MFMGLVFDGIDDHDMAWWQWWAASRIDQGNGGLALLAWDPPPPASVSLDREMLDSTQPTHER